MFELVFFKRYTGFNFQIYDYSGKDNRKVISWILNLGFLRLIKYRIANSEK